MGPKKPPIANEKVLLFYSYDPAQKGKTSPSPGTELYYQTAYELAAQTGKQQAVRDQIIYELRSLINLNYNNYEVQLRANVDEKNLATNIAAVGMSAAATAVGGDTAKILSAITAGVVAANSQIDETVFKHQSMEALRFEMRRLRTQQDTIILINMARPVSEYPLSAATGDLIELYNRGFITRALDSLVTQSAADLKKTQSSNDDAKIDPKGTLDKIKAENAAEAKATMEAAKASASAAAEVAAKAEEAAKKAQQSASEANK